MVTFTVIAEGNLTTRWCMKFDVGRKQKMSPMSSLEDVKEAHIGEQSRQSPESHKRIDGSNRKGDDKTGHATNFCDDPT